MKKRVALLFLSVGFAVSVSLSLAIAALQLSDQPNELTLTDKSSLVGAIDISLSCEGTVRWSTHIRLYVKQILEELILELLDPLGYMTNEVVVRTRGRVKPSTRVRSLIISWTDSIFELAWDPEVSEVQTGSAPLPQIPRWEKDQSGLEVRGLTVAITFCGDAVASFYTLLSLSQPKALCNLKIEKELFHTEGILGVTKSDSTKEIRMEICEDKTSGIPLWMLPDEVAALSDCLGQHLRGFVEEEFADLSDRMNVGDPLEGIRLDILRKCVLEGTIHDNCGVRRQAIIDGNKHEIVVLPRNLTGICYSVFGL